MQTATAPAAQTAGNAFRYLGVTDECVGCQACGRAELRSTVVLAVLDTDGNIDGVTYYGSTCAARALSVHGGSRAVLQSARWAHDRTIADARYAREVLASYGADDTGQIPDRDTARAAARLYRQRNHNVGDDARTPMLALLAHHAAQVAAAQLLDPTF